MARTEALPLPTRRARASTRERREALTFYLLVSPFIVGFLVFTLIPMGGSIALSFTSWDFIHNPVWVGAQNYQNLLSDQDYIQGIKVTLSYAAMALPAGLIMSLVLAMLMNRNIPGVNVFRAIYYMPSLLSGISLAVLWIWVLDQNGILDNILSFFGLPRIAWLTSTDWALRSFILMGLWASGGGILIWLAGLKGIPQDLYEAAGIDGAGWWARLFNVTLPLLTPTIFFNLLTGLIGVFQYFDQSYVMTNGGPPILQGDNIVGATRFYMLKLYNDAFGSNHAFGYAAAQATVLFVVIMIVTMITLKTSRSWVYYEGDVIKGK
jgi:multiple sugar transport system permease protein